MSSNNIINLILNLILKKKNSAQGFTLIELLVVFIIIGILSVVALPNLLSQVGKSRESEAKYALGSIGRLQQAYHFENGVFASQVANLGNTDVSVTAKYHNITDATVANAQRVEHEANALDAVGDGVRNFAVGVYYNAGIYDVVLCQSRDVGGSVNVGNAPVDDCTDNGVKLK